MFLSNFLSNLTLSRGNAFIWDSKIKNLKIISHFRCLDLRSFNWNRKTKENYL